VAPPTLSLIFFIPRARVVKVKHTGVKTVKMPKQKKMSTKLRLGVILFLAHAAGSIPTRMASLRRAVDESPEAHVVLPALLFQLHPSAALPRHLQISGAAAHAVARTVSAAARVKPGSPLPASADGALDLLPHGGRLFRSPHFSKAAAHAAAGLDRWFKLPLNGIAAGLNASTTGHAVSRGGVFTACRGLCVGGVVVFFFSGAGAVM
jgi:hypothetical protein